MNPSIAVATASDVSAHPGSSYQGARADGLTVIVATFMRPELLEKLLISLRSEVRALRELVVATPCRGDATEAVIDRQREHLPMLRIERSKTNAKTVGLNAAIRATDGPHLAFLDDDTEVEPGWAEGFLAQFRRPLAAAYQGRIAAPAKLLNLPRTVEKVRSFTTHPYRDLGPHVRTCHALTGANCAMPRETIGRVGYFDERLGPGAAGLCDDTDLAFRIKREGGEILYTPGAGVVHCWFPERATEQYYVEYLERLGRSRWLMKGRPGWPRLLGDMLWTRMVALGSRVSSDPCVRLHSRAKSIHYSTMWKCALDARRELQGSSAVP